MKKFLQLQINHLFLPISILLTLLAIFLHGQKVLQFEIVMIAVAFYVGIGLLHHHYDKSLTLETALEYILIGGLAIIVLQGILIR